MVKWVTSLVCNPVTAAIVMQKPYQASKRGKTVPNQGFTDCINLTLVQDISDLDSIISLLDYVCALRDRAGGSRSAESRPAESKNEHESWAG